MPNQNFTEFPERKMGGSAVVKVDKKAASESFPERTAGWGQLPGKTQPKDRSLGVKRIQSHPKSSGL